MNEEELRLELETANKKITFLADRIKKIEKNAAMNKLPQTRVISHSFLTRAFAILGHSIVANLIIALPFYLLAFLILLLFR